MYILADIAYAGPCNGSVSTRWHLTSIKHWRNSVAARVSTTGPMKAGPCTIVSSPFGSLAPSLERRHEPALLLRDAELEPFTSRRTTRQALHIRLIWPASTASIIKLPYCSIWPYDVPLPPIVEPYSQSHPPTSLFEAQSR